MILLKQQERQVYDKMKEVDLNTIHEWIKHGETNYGINHLRSILNKEPQVKQGHFMLVKSDHVYYMMANVIASEVSVINFHSLKLEFLISRAMYRLIDELSDVLVPTHMEFVGANLTCGFEVCVNETND